MLYRIKPTFLHQNLEETFATVIQEALSMARRQERVLDPRRLPTLLCDAFEPVAETPPAVKPKVLRSGPA